MAKANVLVAIIAFGGLCVAGARAQTFTNVNVGPLIFQGGPMIQSGPVDTNTDVVELSRPTGGCVVGSGGGSGGCYGSGYTLPLSAFASAQGVSNAVAQLRSHVAQGIALSSAMTIVPPNPGDRFSLTLGGSGYASAGAGSATATYRAADRVLLFGGYGRSASQNLFKGGVSFSFN